MTSNELFLSQAQICLKAFTIYWNLKWNEANKQAAFTNRWLSLNITVNLVLIIYWNVLDCSISLSTDELSPQNMSLKLNNRGCVNGSKIIVDVLMKTIGKTKNLPSTELRQWRIHLRRKKWGGRGCNCRLNYPFEPFFRLWNKRTGCVDDLLNYRNTSN